MEKFPWAKEVNNKNIIQFLPFILKNHNLLRFATAKQNNSTESKENIENCTTTSTTTTTSTDDNKKNDKDNVINYTRKTLSIIENEKLHKGNAKGKVLSTCEAIKSQISPPSFIHNEIMRAKRKEKLDRAKERIKMIGSSLTRKRCSADSISLNEEDLMIERLLLMGADDTSILEGNFASLSASLLSSNNNYNLATTTATSTRNLEAEELNESDLPDDEIFDYLRTNEEIAVLNKIPSKESANKRRKVK